MQSIKIISTNCRGLACRKKREDMFNKWKGDHFDIILIQDTHWTPQTVLQLGNEWEHKHFSSTYSSNSRGTSILLNNYFEFTIGEIKKDPLGNYIFLEILLPDQTSFVIGSIYGPNEDSPSFYNNIDNIIKDFNNPNIIIGGDWNSTRNYDIDNKNYLNKNNPNATKAIDRLIASHNLTDIWRVKNPNVKRYTWLQGISGKQARLDYFLCNEELLSICTETDIAYKYRSDHAPITLKLSINTQIRGPGSWKLNNSLLREKELEKLIKNEIRSFKMVHAATPYNPNYVYGISTKLEFMTDPIIFWEALLCKLRGVIIAYSKRKNRKERVKKTELEEKIIKLDKLISTGKSETSDLQKLKIFNDKLIEARQEKLKGALIRSRAEWLELGEKPSKYFLNLENRNRINKMINEIKTDDNKIIKDQMKILDELRNFYKKLFSKHTPPNEDTSYLPAPKCLNNEEKETLEQPITKKELDSALKALKNNKSPGPDGYTPEFYKKFWPELGHYFLSYVNESKNRGYFTPSFLDGVITCLPKTGKSRNLIKNWRPISLLNTSYKLISTCITNRLRPLLKNIVSSEQKGFLENRSINDCTRLMFDVINGCKEKEIDGLILLVDFEKAFDSISWPFITTALEKMNFGKKFINWVHMFQQGSSSKITLNGHFSLPFALQRGCRQGDPISPYLFILCSEFLALALKNNEEIEGIKILNKEHKLCQYADDTSIFMRATERNLRACIKTLNWFYEVSGLKINIKKTKVIRIGTIRESDRRYCKENKLDWVTSFVSLGIQYDILNMDNITNTNIDEKIPQMKKLIQSWSCRNVTPLGRITVCKSLILSKITHILISLPSPSKEKLKELEKLCIDFIWKNKRHEVSKEILYRDLKDGGLNMINIKEFDSTLKMTWIRRLIKEEPDWMEFAEYYKIDRLLYTEVNYHKTILNKCTNSFWISVINAFSSVYNKIKTEIHIEPEMTPVWGNPILNLPFNITLYNANFRYLKDFYIGNERITQEEIEFYTDKKFPFTDYMAIWNSIPKELKDYMENSNYTQNVMFPITIDWLTRDKKGTKNLRKIFKTGKIELSVCQTKWINELALDDGVNWEKLYMMAKNCNANANILFFNYQILHRTLLTNRKLHQFGLIESEECDTCQESETLLHLLVDCPGNRKLWDDMAQWIMMNLNEHTILDKRSIVLGNHSNSIICNYIILVIKHEIYKSKWSKRKVTKQYIINKLSHYLTIEEYVHTISLGSRKNLGKWSPIYHKIK